MQRVDTYIIAALRLTAFTVTFSSAVLAFAVWPARAVLACVLLDPGRSKPIDVTLLVGELHDSGQYDMEDGVSATTLVDLFRLFPLACNLPHYLERVVEM